LTLFHGFLEGDEGADSLMAFLWRLRYEQGTTDDLDLIAKKRKEG
jgi:hypothetical protein